MSERSQSFTLTKNVGRVFILCFTPPTQWTVWQPHEVKMSRQGIMFSEKVSNKPGLSPVKDRNLTLVHRRGPEINSRASLWVSPRPRHHIQCWLTNQPLILLRVYCLETTNVCWGPTNFRAEPSLASSSTIVRGMRRIQAAACVAWIWR
jgi:hypothetical protein